MSLESVGTYVRIVKSAPLRGHVRSSFLANEESTVETMGPARGSEVKRRPERHSIDTSTLERYLVRTLLIINNNPAAKSIHPTFTLPKYSPNRQ